MPRNYPRHPRPSGDYNRNDGRPGVVYILRNDAHKDGIYKIGQSTYSGARRAADLNREAGTGMPKMFRCIFEVETQDCGRAEKAVHRRLADGRLTRQEFFEVDLDTAKAVIREECSRFDAPKAHRLRWTILADRTCVAFAYACAAGAATQYLVGSDIASVIVSAVAAYGSFAQKNPPKRVLFMGGEAASVQQAVARNARLPH